MEKYNVIENKPYDVNYIAIMNYLLKRENKLGIFFKKIFHLNQRKKNFILNLYERDGKCLQNLEILNNKMSRKLFQAFTMIARPYGGFPTHKNLLCYDSCVEILNRPRKTFSPIFIAKFIECTPTLFWENRIRNSFKYGILKIEHITLIKKLKRKCIWSIYYSNEMTKFIQALGPKNSDLNFRQLKIWEENKKIIDKLIFLIDSEESKSPILT